MPDATRTRATIFDVAEAANVSITTVSHVFSGKRRVNEATRQRVLEAAERLSYRPRAIARALAAGRTNTIALSIPFTGPDLMLNSFFQQFLPALSLAALDRGLSFLYVPPDAAPELAAPLLDGRVDAVVLVLPDDQDPFVRSVFESGVPFVSIGPLTSDVAGRWIGIEAGDIQTAILGHLAERGYERPALLTLEHKAQAIEEQERVFRAVAGADATIVSCAHILERDGYDATLEALSVDEPRPDALVCLSTGIAVGALRACADLELSVPDEMGIVSFGDGPEATHVEPQLTAVNLHPDRHAELAIASLAATLRDEVTEMPVRIEPNLVARASTARGS
jgi:DNA-binding LacI/PurR family transcriptional regulator